MGPYLFFTYQGRPGRARTVFELRLGAGKTEFFRPKKGAVPVTHSRRTCFTFSLSQTTCTHTVCVCLAVALLGLNRKWLLPNTLFLVVCETHNMDLYLIRKISCPRNCISLNTSKLFHSDILFCFKKTKWNGKLLEDEEKGTFHYPILFLVSLLETTSSLLKSCKYQTKNVFLLWTIWV